ncbi:MAG: hypothetical protein FJ220_05510 [Kiritimatiellaceae bacterium]|nr:hypothetical protein [Kiritimatiellaceae bacterium]
MTLLYTPGVHTKHVQQSSQDWGRHEFIYGLAGHTGDWRSSKADWTAMRMNQPMPVFQSTKHSGQLGRSFSLIQTSSDQIAVQAVKRAEDHEGIVLRVQELHGKPARDVTIQMTPGILSATEINGVETALHEVPVADDKMQLDFTPYQLRSFSLTMNPPTHPQVAAPSQAIVLPYDCDGFSYNRELTDSRAGFDNEGRSIPAEMISNTVTASGVTFQIGPREKDQLNVITCRGQTLPLPSGDWNRVYLLAASAGEDTLGTFSMGSTTTPLRIQSWNGFIGQWDTRIFKEDTVTAITPGFIKRDPLAWFCSHRHLEKGQDDAYAFSYLFIYSLELPAGTTSLTLPKNDKIRIVALSVAQDNVDRITPVTPLYDDFSDRKELKLNVPKKSSKK